MKKLEEIQNTICDYIKSYEKTNDKFIKSVYVKMINYWMKEYENEKE